MPRLTVTLVTFALALIFVACGDDSGSSQDLLGGTDMSACQGGPLSGAADSHCGASFVTVAPDQCTVDAGADVGGDYGDTMSGTMGYDDDCKYKVSFTVDPICENQGVTFTVTATYAVDNTPVKGAKMRAEVFLDETHPAPNSGALPSEPTPGTYKFGPVRFDKAGKWTTRFHFFEDCADSETSPHGHAAYFLNVP